MDLLAQNSTRNFWEDTTEHRERSNETRHLLRKVAPFLCKSPRMSSSGSILQFQIPSTRTIISTAASAAATAMLVRSIIREQIPKEIQHYIYAKLRGIFSSLSNQFTIVIEDLDGIAPNQLFKAAEIYLRPTASPETKRFRAYIPKKETKISFVMERNSEMMDSFNGVKLKWRLVTKQIKPAYIGGPDPFNPSYVSELRRHELTFHKKHREMVLTTYLPYVLDSSREMKQENKTLKLFTLSMGRRWIRRSNPWQSVNLDHPASFETVAMDPGAKEAIIEDLERFLKRKSMYRRVGKAWKRGYLLYGPPGTGKSSLIAAMANYLNFDIYDLELDGVRNNSQLRQLLMLTANKSILVVEDIDCSVKITDRRPKRIYYDRRGNIIEDKGVTLSGLLNFVDGLWSSCGDERIIIFTTNHKDKIDPALLRPGRMDVHIHMSYCTPGGFEKLALNYLGTTSHPLFPKVKDLIGQLMVTPAEVGEQLMRHEGLEPAIRGLIEFLEEKRASSEPGTSEAKVAEMVLQIGGNKK